INFADSGCTASYSFSQEENDNRSLYMNAYHTCDPPSATAVTVAGGVSFTYDGLSHPATVAVTGIGGLNDSPAPVYSCGHAPINFADSGCTASYSFAGDANHNGSSDSKTTRMNTTHRATAVTVAGGVSFTYDGLSHPATVAVT